MTTWATRPETADDITAIRDVNLAAFPTAAEAGLVDALRADPTAWIDGLSMVTTAPDGTVVGHALLTRCHIDGEPALALAPCAVLPTFQRRGAGSAAIRAGLNAARARGKPRRRAGTRRLLPAVRLHPGLVLRYPRALRAPFAAPDEALMALALDEIRPVPSGTIAYPAAFGV